MSYSALIQKDKPDIFWSLDETSGTVVFADGYIIDPDISPTKTVLNQGVYGASIGSGITSNPLPIIYGGSSCIKINNSESTSFIKVPSLYKMTTADAKNPSAIEFWIKISNTSTTRQNFMTTDSGASIGIVSDHIIFSIGSYSVSVYVDTVNKPIHIIAGYSPNELTLIVNGILKTKKIFKYSDIFTDTWNNGGAGVNKNDFKFVKPSGITNFQIDSVSLYSYIPSRIIALRHYGYGVAYNPPTEFFDGNNAVYYNFSMENQQVIQKYSMGQSGDSWKITDSNNALIENDCLTIKKRNLLNVNFPIDYGDISNLQSYFKILNSANLVINSSFESGTTGWFGNDYATITLASYDSLFGLNSLEVTQVAAFYSGVTISSTIPVSPSTTYTYSYYIKTAPGTASIAVGNIVHALNSAGTLINQYNQNNITYNASANWTRVINTFTTSSITASVRLFVCNNASPASSAVAGQKFLIDGVMLEKSSSVGTYMSDQYAFETKSYLTLENTDSLIPSVNGGWAFKFNKTSKFSTTATIGTVSGSGPFTATISGITSSPPFVGQVITATAGSGTLGSGVVTVTSVINEKTITVSSTLTMTAGIITDLISIGNLTPQQTFFYVGSNNSNNYIEVKASTSGITVYLNGLSTLTFTISSIPDYFYLGYYIKSNETIDFIYLPSTGSASIQNTGVLNGLNFTNTFIRIGSSNVWTKDNDSSVVDKATQGLSTFNLSKITAIHKDNSSLYSTYANIEGGSFKHYYTVVPNYLEKRFKTKSYASGTTSIALQSLLNEDTSYAGATRLEIGNPYGNDNLKVYVTGNRYTTNNNAVTTSNFKARTQLTDRVIVNGDWLNKQNIILSPSQSVSDVLDFEFELYTDDLFEQPTTLNYFRLFSYPVIEDGSNKYTLCSGSRSGNPVKIYYRNNEFAIPDLTEKPFFYNGFNSGIKINNSYATIEHTFSSPDKYAEIKGPTGATKGSPTIYNLNYVPFEVGDKVIICDTNVNKDITFSFTPDNPIIVTSTSHGLSTGSRIQFVVTLDANGDPDYILPGYLYDDVDYFVKSIDANSFHITDVVGGDIIVALDDESGSLVVPALIKSGSPWELNTETTISSKTNTTITLPIDSSSYTEWIADDSDKDGTSGVIKLASGIGSVSFMVYADTPIASLKLLKIGSTQISLSIGGVISTGSTSTKYVNGVSGGTFKFGSWNNITITFADLIIVNGNQPVLLTIGDSSAVTETFYLDQLSIFDKQLSSYFVKDLYCLYTGKNDVDLFTQTVDTGFKIYDLGPATAGEDEYTINENIVAVDHILPSTSTSSLYSILSVQTGDTYTLSLSYQQVDGEEVLTKNTVKKTATSGSSSILYLADSANLSVGAKIVKIGDTDITSSNPTITAIDDTPITKTTTSSIAASSLGTHTFTNLSTVNGISIGDKVSSSVKYETKVNGKKVEKYAIPEGTEVQKINGSNITIQFPSDKKGFKAAIPSGKKITFTPNSAKVTVTSLPNVANLGTAISFENIKKTQNIAQNNKLIVDGEYLKSGDKLLFKDVSPPIMYQVSSTSVDQQIYNTTKTVTVSFSKIALIDGYVYSDDEDLTISPGEDENKLIKYNSSNTPPFSNYSDFRDKKVSYSQPPQYAIQE